MSFRCNICGRVVPNSEGCADDMPEACDACWAKAHRPRRRKLTNRLLCAHERYVMVRPTSFGKLRHPDSFATMICMGCGDARHLRRRDDTLLLGRAPWCRVNTGKRLRPREQPVYPFGASLTLCRVKGHPSSLPTHPARWS